MNHPQQPVILPEDFPPGEADSCRKCNLSNQRTRVIWGEGNPEAPVFVILDNPGAREDRTGQPFLCGTRETLQKAAYDAGLTRDELYVTYILKCRPLRAYDKPLSRNICVSYIWDQLDQAKPSIIMILGNVAIQSLWGDPEAEVKHLRGSFQTLGRYKAVVSYHPLAVRRRPTLYRHFVQDWALVAAGLITLDP